MDKSAQHNSAPTTARRQKRADKNAPILNTRRQMHADKCALENVRMSF